MQYVGLQNKRSNMVVCRVGDHGSTIRGPEAMSASKVLRNMAVILTILHA
jgi:hypothetical protein